MNIKIDEIVEEVIRRLKIYLNEKRILLILRDDSNFEEAADLVKILKERGYTFHLLSLLTKDLKVLERQEFKEMKRIRSGIFKEEEYEHFMKDYESLLISDLKMLEVQAYHELYFSETLGKLVFHTIKENKPVYGFSKEMKGVRNDYLKQKMDEIKDELRRLKIHILTEKIGLGLSESEVSKVGSSGKTETVKQSDERRIIKNSDRYKAVNQEGLDLREKFITLSDVMSIEGLNEKKTLKISGQSRLTMEASDHLNRLGVRLLRTLE